MIVGLCGYAGSGKDTMANILVQERGFERRAFADKLKDIAYSLDPDLAEVVDTVGWDVAKQIPSYRALLQNLGVAVRHHLGEHTWVDAVIHSNIIPWDKIVITDVRFHNEIDRILDLGGKIGEVKRPSVGPVNEHVSEAEWTQRRNEFHFTIHNNKSLVYMRPKLLSLADAGFVQKET